MIKATTLMLDVLKKYQLRIDAFQKKSDEIISEVFLKHPDLLEFRKEYSALRMIERKAEDKKEIRKKYENIYKEYEKLFNRYLELEGYNKQDLVYKPLCKVCNDTGYVGETEKSYCSCVVAQAAQKMLESANINNHETMGNFDINLFDNNTVFKNDMTQRQQMQKLYEFLKGFTRDFPNCKKNQIIITGSVGLGKSYCLNAIAHDVLKKGYSAMLITSFSINEAAFDEIKHSDSSALNMMRKVDLLLIDDLGSEQVLNNITRPTLFNILNERVRRNRHTIISTNLSAEDIEIRYGVRVFSRLIDKNRTMIFPLLGKDIRSRI